MASIRFQHLDFQYDSSYNPVFTDLNLVLDSTWRTGLVGRNGRGKSTLLKLLAGSLVPSAGMADVHVSTRYFPAIGDADTPTIDVLRNDIAPFSHWENEMNQLLELGDEPALAEYSLIQEQYQSAGGYEINGNIEREFLLMGLDCSLLAREFGTLSGGEQTRALVTSLFLRVEDFPLIDEPTNHLDMQGRSALSEYLSSKSGFLLVSHDRFFLDGCVDHILSLNKSDVRINHGNYSQWREHMEQEELHETRARTNLEREIKQLKKAARQKRGHAHSREGDKYRTGAFDKGYVGHRAAKQMKRAKTIENRAIDNFEEKQQLLKNREKVRELQVSTAHHSERELLRVQDLSLSRGRKLFQNLSFTVSSGDRIAVIGPNGCGKSSLFDVISGRLHADEGIVYKPGQITIEEATQNPLWVQGLLRELLQLHQLDETRFRQILGVFNVPAEVFDRPLETFSLGQLKKVDLCRSLMSKADILLWDEPMNYIDVLSREQIEKAVLEYEPSMLFIEHDRAFVDHVATEVIKLDKSYLTSS